MHYRRKQQHSGILIIVTALLGVSIVFLAFRLRQYHAVLATLPEGVSLPRSETQVRATAAVKVQVSKDKIWVDSNTVLSSDNIAPAVYDQDGRRIIPLYDALVKRKEELQVLALQIPHAMKFEGIVSLVVDKSIKYSYLKKVLHTCEEAGFSDFRFIVLEK